MVDLLLTQGYLDRSFVNSQRKKKKIDNDLGSLQKEKILKILSLNEILDFKISIIKAFSSTIFHVNQNIF